MAEVDAGEETLIHGAQLQHLVQIPQLVYFPHGLGAQNDVPEALVVTGGHHLPKGSEGDVLGLPPRPLHEGPGVDDHPLRSHPLGHPAGGGDVADGLLQRLGVGVCQVNKVGGVEGEGDARLPGACPHRSCGLLPHVDALAALVFVAIEAQRGNPAGGVGGGLVDFGEALRIARGAEPGAHRKGLPFPSRRKGVSMA